MTRTVTVAELEDLRNRLERWAVWRARQASGPMFGSGGGGASFVRGGAMRETPKLSPEERYRLALEFPKAGDRVRSTRPGKRAATVTPIDVANQRIDSAVLQLPEIYRITVMVEYCAYLKRPGDRWDQETRAAKLGIKARTFRDRLHIALVVLCRALNKGDEQTTPRRPAGVFL